MQDASKIEIFKQMPWEHKPKNPKSLLGYQFANIEQITKEAVKEAYDLVVMGRNEGAKMRMWAHETNKLTQEMADWAYQILQELNEKKYITREVKRKLRELGEHEAKVLQEVHKYMGGMAQIVDRLKGLNPPLKSVELKPFIDAVKEDRERTIFALDVLTSHLERLIQNKMQLCRDFEQYD
jgi:predicted nuclease with TOPRIM domain